MEKNEQQMPRLGEPVPAFEAMTTKGKISFPDDYKGKWVILFSHPADFTPICTTEILTFGARTEEFRALNCELVGLSVDSRNSHIAWLKTIREKIEYKGMKDVKVGFPIIDDVAMKVASLYGMIQPGESQTAAVRAVFFVDPKGVLRAMIYYPLALGRNFDEIRRVLVGLQTIDAFGIALPADWRPGDEVIVPMKGDDQEKVPEGAKCYDWFFCTKPLPKEEIGRKLGDEGLLRQMVSLLLDNAVKYGKSYVKISARKTITKLKRIIVLEFRNDAENVEQGNLDKYFARFFRSDGARASGIEGSGIGLSIVQEIAELHKGKVSARGEGNDFVVTITFDKFSFGHVKKERENE